MIAVHVLGAWQPASGIMVRVAGAWRKVTGMQVRRGGVWQNVSGFTPAFSASAPSEADGYTSTRKPVAGAVTSNGVAITPNGGASPYNYTWTRISGDTRITATTATMASTAFRATLTNDTATALFQWVATDANGATASGQVYVTLQVESQI